MVVVLDETGARNPPAAAPVSSSAPAAPADQPGALELTFVCRNCCLEHDEPFCAFCGATSLELVSA